MGRSRFEKHIYERQAWGGNKEAMLDNLSYLAEFYVRDERIAFGVFDDAIDRMAETQVETVEFHNSWGIRHEVYPDDLGPRLLMIRANGFTTWNICAYMPCPIEEQIMQDHRSCITSLLCHRLEPKATERFIKRYLDQQVKPQRVLTLPPPAPTPKQRARERLRAYLDALPFEDQAISRQARGLLDMTKKRPMKTSVHAPANLSKAMTCQSSQSVESGHAFRSTHARREK